MESTISPLTLASPVPSQAATQSLAAWLLPAVVLAALVSIGGPLLLRMPVSTDTALYDLQATNVMTGGAAYRDLFEPNLPGVVWIHVAVRSLLGPSWEALRLADLMLFGATVWLLVRWQPGWSAARRLWAAVALSWLYLSVSEWCHCQRDIWLLVPALAGLHLRTRQAERIDAGSSNWAVVGWGLLEGLCWGAAVWIKPFVMVPAGCAWLASLLGMRRGGARWTDLAGLICGGLLAGTAGVAWLVANGAWADFYATLLEWNPEYAAARFTGWNLPRVAGTLWRLFPWVALHLVAVPTAVVAIFASRRSRLLAVFYLGWLVQSLLLQHVFDYVHLPGIVLAIGVLMDGNWTSRGWRLGLAAFCLVAVLCSGLLRTDRLTCWRITREPTPADVHARLARLNQTQWRDLERVADYLRGLHLADGELTCFNSTLVYLYPKLGLKPSTRYVFLDSICMLCPKHQDEVYRAVQQSKQRYVVVDLVTAGVPAAVADLGGLKSTKANSTKPVTTTGGAKQSFPWSEEYAFRAGRYVVYRVQPPIGPLQVFLPEVRPPHVAGR